MVLLDAPPCLRHTIPTTIVVLSSHIVRSCASRNAMPSHPYFLLDVFVDFNFKYARDGSITPCPVYGERGRTP